MRAAVAAKDLSLPRGRVVDKETSSHLGGHLHRPKMEAVAGAEEAATKAATKVVGGQMADPEVMADLEVVEVRTLAQKENRGLLPGTAKESCRENRCGN